MSFNNDRIYKLKPEYLAEYETLVRFHSQYGGGSKDEKFHRGKSFSNVYEFYIYAFFIGLYRNDRKEILDEDDKKSFWEMENWKPRELTDYMLTCAIAQSDFDMIMFEQMDDDGIRVQLKLLKNIIEEYANAGFGYINDRLEKEPDLIDDDMFFIKLLSECVEE